ncbi:MAG: hypothetical protein U1E50_14455 [Caulobacteraceae bacterium]
MSIAAPQDRTLSILTRLEAARLAAFWRYASRDWVFVLGVLAAIPLVAAGAREGLRPVLQGSAVQQAVVFAGLGAVSFLGLMRGAEPRKTKLNEGPFHAFVRDRRQVARWMVARSAAWAAVIDVLLTTLIFSMKPASGLTGGGAFLAGALVVGLWLIAAPERDATRTLRIDPHQRFGGGSGQHVLTIIVLSSLRGRWLMALLSLALIAAGGLAAGLAARNNHSPGLGYILCTLVGFLAGAVLQPRAKLTKLAGQQPLTLIGLFARLYALPLGVAAAGGLTAALVAGLGIVIGLQAALGAFTAMLVLGWIAFLHRMIRSARNANQGAVLEFGGMLLLSSIEASLAPLWIAARALILVRAARRGRWLDR